MDRQKSPLLQGFLRRLPLLLAFFMPFFIVSIAYIVAEVFPFGRRQILASDGWHQYYPFLLTLREKLLNGESLEYIRNIGMGSNYLSLFAYYVASPLYLLSVLVPLEYMREFFTLITVVKLSLAGLFFAYFLRIVYRRNEISGAFFALMYALCAWAAGYYWNIMWLDTFALLPLLIAGMVSLLRDGRFRLYILALAFSLWCNYYVAYFCCIFVLLSFIGYCIICWNGFGNFLRRFLRIGVCTLIGAGLAAVLLLPTLQAMQTTQSAKGTEVELLAMNLPERITGDPGFSTMWEYVKEEILPALATALRQICGQLVPGNEPTSMSGLPNVFCSFTAVILAVFFFCNGKIKLREKIFNLLLLLFLFLSFIFRILDYAWHGFHFPNMLPYRFSFLVPFVLICMAYRAYTLMDNFKYWKLAIIVPLVALFGVNVYFSDDTSMQVLLLTGIVTAAGIVFFVLYGQKTARAAQRARYARIFLCSIILCEMILSFSLGVDKVGTSSHNSYPSYDTQMQSLLAYADKNDDDLYYRTEVTKTQTLNDGALNNYYGLSVFNSSANVNFNRFSRSLGFAAWPESNRYAYYETSPFGNTFAGLKYLIDRENHHLSSYNTLVAMSGNCRLLENSSYIGLGFMTDSALATYVSRAAQKNPLLDQEEMFTLATGIDERLYRHLEYESLSTEDGCTLKKSTNRTSFHYSRAEDATTGSYSIHYTMQEDGLLLAAVYMGNSDAVTVYRNGVELISRPSKVRTLLCIGDVDNGDEITFTFEGEGYASGTIMLDVALQNNGYYDMGMERLADEVWELTEATDTYLCGTIEVKQDGLFYTAIPYEPGWTAYVDGEEVALAETYDPSAQDVLLTDAVISFPLSVGYHIIELKYEAPGLKTGLIISLVCLVVFIALVILLRKNPVLWPDVVPELPAEPISPEAEDDTEEDDFDALLEKWTQEAPPSTKKLIRQQIAAQKRLLSQAQIDAASEVLMERLVQHPLYQNAEAIYGYLSYNQEVRTEPILRRAQADGKRIAVPKVFGEEMRFLWLTDWEQIAEGYRGIPEPIDGELADDKNALVLMPGLAFDAQGHRLGYGGGFYDRFLASEPHPTLALCYDFQLLESLETEQHDVPVDAVLSTPID